MGANEEELGTPDATAGDVGGAESAPEGDVEATQDAPAAEAAPAVESWKGPSKEEWEGVTKSHASLTQELAQIRQLMQQGFSKPEAKAIVADAKAPDDDDPNDEFSDEEKFKKAWERRVKDPRYERSILHREAKRAVRGDLSKIADIQKQMAEYRNELNTLHGSQMYANKMFAKDPVAAKYDKAFIENINSRRFNDVEAAWENAVLKVDSTAAKAKPAVAAVKIPPKPSPRVDASLTPSRTAGGASRQPAGAGAASGSGKGLDRFAAIQARVNKSFKG